MASIDRADWHYGGDYPKGLPPENGGTHIGVYISWIIDNDLVGTLHLEDSMQGIEDIKARKITGRDFLFDYCAEKFREEDLSAEGLAFTKYYYQNLKSSEAPGRYLEDYEKSLGSELESLYEISNSWENYDIMADQINTAYRSWKNKGNKKKWQFWKQ